MITNQRKRYKITREDFEKLSEPQQKSLKEDVYFIDHDNQVFYTKHRG